MAGATSYSKGMRPAPNAREVTLPRTSKDSTSSKTLTRTKMVVGGYSWPSKTHRCTVVAAVKKACMSRDSMGY
jgi:hypothetical protein